ncbi:glycoside hydrolase family 92 protein [Sphingomonas sp. ABOLF]|uniref:GH92 family glycosyl hydrolase n=1 Tax=Sphingomonas sp. ABOLF TaxID=1985879 RepID=UPI000F7F77B2|nr:GH92 family glycosyl hydrolase [Sphingomonas sp. ABOLF]RSV17029.1 glycoside hydrolase family 92 protein [Sphingomonas sp. ABOLF]GLK21735.1 alpha-1 2-mannosidase [Microbacterium terregens]
MTNTIAKALRGASAALLATTALVPGAMPGPMAAVAQDRAPATEALVDLVNPLMGSDSSYELSYGNTYPAVAVPWGMNFWTPVTGKMGSGWGYTYAAHKINGIKQTHQPSPWMNDYAAFALFAETGPLKVKEEERASWFSHKAEDSRPYRYKVYLADYDVTAELTPTERAAQFRFTFPKADDAHIILDAYNGGSMVQIDPVKRRITGYVRNNHGGVPDNFHNYFVAEFDHDFTVTRTWDDNGQVTAERSREGDHVGAVVSFKTQAGEQVGVKVASSFISPEQAVRNLEREIGRDSYDQTEAKARQVWEKELRRVQVSDPNIDNRRTFYSALWRMLQFPRMFHETDAADKTVHYSPYDGKVHDGVLYTDNGFWDTWRAVFPWFALMYPERDGEIMQGLVNTYKESGWLPEWASPGHRNVMIGSNSANLIADAYLNGVRGFDVETLYEAMVKNATTSEGRPRDKRGNVVSAVGREGVEYYNRLGYVPYDVGINENAARTLEYATADFSLSRLAQALGKTEDARRYAQQAQNYRKLFDAQSGWMRGRNQDGSWSTPFNPYKWGDAFTEGNSVHYSWSVMQDVQGLVDLMGGDQKFVNRLDSVFMTPPVFDDSYYGQVIHEIREMQIVNMGQYAHGNQPIQHMPYLYDWAGAPWKTQYHVRDVLKKLYSSAPDGYPGDEDNGQTSAWYVFSALGFYPVTPAVGEYAIGSPLFRTVRLTMPNGKVLTIEAVNNSAENVYIQSATFNGKPHDKAWLSREALQQGGTLRFVMGAKPNKAWASGKAAAPFSMSAPK